MVFDTPLRRVGAGRQRSNGLQKQKVYNATTSHQSRVPRINRQFGASVDNSTQTDVLDFAAAVDAVIGKQRAT